jgi:hypothetical protein
VPNIGDRDAEILGEGARSIHAYTLSVLAQVTATSQTIPTPAADDVPFAGYDLPDVEIMDIAAHRSHRPDELMPDDHRNRDGPLRPCVPIPYVHVGTTYGRLVNPYQNVIDARLRDWYFL